MYKVGDRIEMIHMGNDPDPIKSGTQGTITNVADFPPSMGGGTQLSVKWDNGRTLGVCLPEDIVKLI